MTTVAQGQMSRSVNRSPMVPPVSDDPPEGDADPRAGGHDGDDLAGRAGDVPYGHVIAAELYGAILNHGL